MTKRKAERTPKKQAPPPPRPAPHQDGALDGTGRWYLDCLERMTAHLGRPPSILELATWIGGTATPVHRHLTRLEAGGYLKRDDRRRFVRTVKQ